MVTGADTDVQGECRGTQHVPRRPDRVHARLLISSLLCRGQRPGVTDRIDPRRVLVGDHHHDDGWLWRQGPSRMDGPYYWCCVCHIGDTDTGHTGTDHCWSFQPVLLAQDGSRPATNVQLIGYRLLVISDQ